MEKLISLINEYEQLNMCRKFDSFEMHTFENSNWVDRLLEDTVISHRYWFIKRLVENDKIDFEKNKLQVLKDIDVRWEVFYDYTLFDKVDWVIMLLSIQDEPVKFLSDILK